jgi:two-component system NarL family sensor kinase
VEAHDGGETEQAVVVLDGVGGHEMSKRSVVLVAWSLWLGTLANCAAGLVVAMVVTRPISLAVLANQAVGTVLVLSITTIGLVLALRRPANPIGWLYATAGLVGSLSNPWSLWVDQLIRTGRPLPLVGQVAALVKEFDWAPTVALVVTLPFLLVPDGRLHSPRWRLAAAASIIAAIMGPVAGSLVPGQLVQIPIANPFGLRGMPAAVAAAVAYVCLALYWGSVLAALVCVVLRFRASRGIERQQLRWVAAGATAAVIGLVLTTLVVHGILPWVAGPVAYAAVLAMPISVAVAILRYRLYDLDYLISRTVVYGLLTAGGVGVYVGVVKGAEWLLREGAGFGGSLLATAVIAVGFAPARDRLQRWVDRRLYGERHDPVRAVARLGERLRNAPGSAPGGDVLAGVLQAVCETLRLPWASLRVDQTEVVAVGRPATASESIPLEHEGQCIGALLVGVRSGEDALGAADRQVLDLLAAPVAVALHAVLLSQELQRSRERLVAAREEERRRLRRDLHDGLGPILTAVTLKADAARSALDTAPDRADGLLAELRGDANQAIRDLRRVIYDLRPAALDELGLLGALGEQVDRFGRQGLSISLHAPEALPVLPAAVEVAAYRIIAEALTNIARHAQAHQVAITVAIDSDLCVAVQDDGTTGTANGDGWRPGTGLQSMAERVAEVGGTLEVGPTSTGGRVYASLPLELA